MPAFLVPRHVSAHRISAIALYRALLQQSRQLPLPPQSKHELQNIVRNRFKQVIHLHSYQRLKLAFQAGYEAIDHLDASAAGDEHSTAYIASLVSRAPAKVKADPPRPAVPEKKRDAQKRLREERRLTEPKASSEPPFKPITELLSRPHPLSSLSGKRHVPVLFSASNIPVLRIKKPQPEHLSGFLKHRIKQRQRRHDRRHWLTEQMEFAEYEDLWDRIVEGHTGVPADGDGDWEPAWADAFRKAKWDVEGQLHLENRKNMAMAERMQGVVDRETELFERERDERRLAKKVEREERRRVREGGEKGVVG